MNTKSYKGRKPLRIAAALILALAMMVTAMPMTVIAQTVTTASQAAETNETPVQSSEAEEAPLAENAAFEEKAEAEENSYEAAAPEAQQETSEEIKTETTVAETSSETRKAQEKALPEKSGDYPYEHMDGNYGDQVNEGDAYVYLRYFIVDDTAGNLFEVTGYNAKYYRTGAAREDANLVNVWDHTYYDYYHGEKINLSTISNNTLDIAKKMIPTSIDQSSELKGVGVALNYKALEGSETEFYHRYSVCFAIGPSSKRNVNLFNDTYERTDFMQFRKVGYYGPMEGGPYIRPAASSGNKEVQWSFTGKDGDFRTYGVAEDNDVPSVYVIFKRAGIENTNDANLIIDHKAIGDAADIEQNDITVLNGSGERTINDCEVTAFVDNTQLPSCSLKNYINSGDLRISEQQLMTAVANKIGNNPETYNPGFDDDTSEYKFRVKLAVANDTLGDVYVQTAKAVNDAHYSYYSKYSQVTSSIDTTPTDINSINWVDAGNGWFETDLINIYRLLDAANDGDFDNTITSADNVITETLYSNASSENFTVSFKYYDKDRSAENSNKPADVSYTPTVVPVKTTLPETYNSNVMETILFDAEGSINTSNNLDEIHFNVTSEAYDYLLDDMDVFPYHGGGYYYDHNYSDGFHTDWYGRVYSDTDYMMEKPLSENELPEKWITYYDASGREIAETEYTASGFDKHRISNVVIWGYNAPKVYSVNYVMPNADSHLNSYEYVDQSGKTHNVWFESKENATAINRGFFYNQRIGDEFVKSGESAPESSDLRNSVTNHLTKWGLTSVNGLYLGNGDNSPAVIAEDTAPCDSNLVFDGWYVNNGTPQKPDYVKVSSDKEYGGRVLSGMTLYAGYTESENVSEDECGFALTDLPVEMYYSDNGASRAVLTSLLNAYGYPDGESALNDLDEKKLAVIYVTLNDKDFPGNYVDPKAKTVADLIKDTQNFETYVKMALANDSASGINMTIKDVSGTSTTCKAICYSYTLDITDPDDLNETGTSSASGNVLKLTNKNRAQFSLDMSSAALQTVSYGGTGAYPFILAFTAYLPDGDDPNANLVFSDNYIYYSEPLN